MEKERRKKDILTGFSMMSGNNWLKDQAVVLVRGKINAIIPSKMIDNHMPANVMTFNSTDQLIPGLIDMHVHGMKDADVMDATEEALVTISNALKSQGTTGFLATTMTASHEKMEAVLKNIAEHGKKLPGAQLLGIHLEGPFLAANKAGAQSKQHFELPNIKLFDKWQALSGHQIKQVTVAPELEGACDFIAHLRKNSVIASIGHTHATFQESERAIASGASCATHLFNAMRAIHQREPGVLLSLLESPSVNAELIVDRVHVHDALVRFAFQLKSKEQLHLVSDAIRACGMPDGDYELGGQTVSVKAGAAYLPDGTLAGSTLTLVQAMKNMMAVTDCTLHDAIYMASRMPAKLLGYALTKGNIAVGMDADLVVLDGERKVKEVFVSKG